MFAVLCLAFGLNLMSPVAVAQASSNPQPDMPGSCPIAVPCNAHDAFCTHLREPYSQYPVEPSCETCGFGESNEKCGWKSCGPGGMFACVCGVYKTDGNACDGVGC